MHILTHTHVCLRFRGRPDAGRQEEDPAPEAGQPSSGLGRGQKGLETEGFQFLVTRVQICALMCTWYMYTYDSRLCMSECTRLVGNVAGVHVWMCEGVRASMYARTLILTCMYASAQGVVCSE